MNISIFDKSMNDFNLKRPLKVALATVSLSGGGAERVAAILSNYFVAQGIEVHHLVFSGTIEYEYSGKLMHFESLKDTNNSLWSRIKRFKAIYTYCKQEQFDFIIDFRIKERFWQEVLLHHLVYNHLIQTIHSFKIESYIPKSKWKAWMLYHKAKAMITVSDSILAKVENDYYNKHLFTIYNPIDLDYFETKVNDSILFQNQYIVAAGSMNQNIKQFDKLIEIYSKSTLPKQNIHLVILGEGDLKINYIQLAHSLFLNDKIHFLGHVDNPFSYYKNALFGVSTSLYEGLPMVLLEILACGTPVVSWNYESGPSEIIQDQQNGLLVLNQDIEAMVEAFNAMIEDNELYLRCKSESKNSIRDFSIDKIGATWMKLFEKLQNKGA